MENNTKKHLKIALFLMVIFIILFYINDYKNPLFLLIVAFFLSQIFCFFTNKIMLVGYTWSRPNKKNYKYRMFSSTLYILLLIFVFIDLVIKTDWTNYFS